MQLDVYDFDNEVISPTDRQPKVRGCTKYQEYLNEKLPFMRVQWPYLPVGMLRRKCKKRWFQMTGRVTGSQKQYLPQPQKTKRKVSFNESAEVRQIGASQSQRSRRTAHFSPLKSDPPVPSANRLRRTVIEVVPDPDHGTESESPISRRMQELEIGRRGSDVSAAGGDQAAAADEDHTIQFPDSPTPVFQDTTPPSSPLSPQLSFTHTRSSVFSGASESGLFRTKQKTYTGVSNRREEQPAAAAAAGSDENRRTGGAGNKRKVKVVQSELLPLKKHSGKKFASAMESVPLVRRVPLRCVASDLIRLVTRKLPVKETPKTSQPQTPLLVPKKYKVEPVQKKKHNK